MFHAIGLPLKISGHVLRKRVGNYIAENADAVLHGARIRDWIEWDQGISPETYVMKLQNGLWGGSLETTLIASMLRIPVFVYAPKGNMCTRISEARPDTNIKRMELAITNIPKFICVLWIQKNHYMSLGIKK